MPITRVARSEDLREGEGKTVTLVPGKTAYVFRYKNTLRAFVNRCPHMGGPVELDARAGECVCRWHEASFDALSGARKEGEAAEGSALTPLHVEEADGQIHLAWTLPNDPFDF